MVYECHLVRAAQQMCHISGGHVFCENFAFRGVTLCCASCLGRLFLAERLRTRLYQSLCI